ncbi:pantoate--beta-alanine ligase [Gryllotalpicola protaetiae]|uniref:Pantothenate synthetase n=1 Tax=Gryllotalpicola protaetiae TaxID=2419771 RepID=A0A387BGR8_9MICO|nr:pantoate--beta-alanine ligase [Gryllotalpicola protaetiae]AYG03113.1 pantoate--beta-alanine ligase [Gryllotalpicola protaetiae]
MSAAPTVLETIAATRDFVRAAHAAGQRVALVPTMGALHDGHLALVARGRELADVVIVSIFVNPLQFGPNEDFERYPRTLGADLAVLAGRADAVFAPVVAEMYPGGASQTTVHAGPVAERYEGASRPGHFDGMLTVVSKLLNIVQPDVALFGQKDAQQAFLVTQLVADLNLPVVIEAVPTVRESDGLALSSRNRYLSSDERMLALTLSAALEAARQASVMPADDRVAAARSAGLARFDQQPDVRLDYLVIVDPATFLPLEDDATGDALILVAARVGATRLIDNAPLHF